MPPSAPYHHPACQHRLVAKARLPEFLESWLPLSPCSPKTERLLRARFPEISF